MKKAAKEAMTKVESEFTYACHFYFKGQNLKATDDRGIAIFMHGFWIDEKGVYDRWKGSKVRYWIPPQAIDYIEKVRK